MSTEVLEQQTIGLDSLDLLEETAARAAGDYYRLVIGIASGSSFEADEVRQVLATVGKTGSQFRADCVRVRRRKEAFERLTQTGSLTIDSALQRVADIQKVIAEAAGKSLPIAEHRDLSDRLARELTDAQLALRVANRKHRDEEVQLFRLIEETGELLNIRYREKNAELQRERLAIEAEIWKRDEAGLRAAMLSLESRVAEHLAAGLTTDMSLVERKRETVARIKTKLTEIDKMKAVAAALLEQQRFQVERHNAELQRHYSWQSIKLELLG